MKTKVEFTTHKDRTLYSYEEMRQREGLYRTTDEAGMIGEYLFIVTPDVNTYKEMAIIVLTPTGIGVNNIFSTWGPLDFVEVHETINVEFKN
jgi:hypothetical protein